MCIIFVRLIYGLFNLMKGA